MWVEKRETSSTWDEAQEYVRKQLESDWTVTITWIEPNEPE